MAHLDYLRIGTWDLKQYTRLASYLMQRFHGWQPGSWLQYHGHKYESIFFGTARQDEKSHYIMQVSGGLSQTLIDDDEINLLLSHEAFYATRIDIQRTMDLPEWWNVRDVADSMKQAGLTMSFIESDSGSTVYIGRRTSDKFIRIYVKNLEKQYLRLEYEIKGDLARSVFRHHWQNGQSSLTAIYNGLLAKQKMPQYVTSYYLDPDSGTIDVRAKEHAHDQKKRLNWLTTLEPTIRMMMADHDIGRETRVFIQSLAKYAGTLDTGATSGVSSS